MTSRVPEKLKWLAEHLPERYKAWQVKEQAAVLLNISPERAEQYLRMLWMFGLVKWNGWEFEKVDKTVKKVTLNDLKDIQVDNNNGDDNGT
jgi:hypothetical protein